MARNFITGSELSPDELVEVLARAAELKGDRGARAGADALPGKSVGLIFEMPSTRTRISFEVGVAELGMHPVVLKGEEMQISRGESIGDTARVLSRYLHAIVVRAGSNEAVEGLAGAADIPVVNALTPLHHPCQALADLMTLAERFGTLDGLKVAYLGEGNNVARSLALLGSLAGVDVVTASPEGYELTDCPEATVVSNPEEAVRDANALYTDVWFSMGDESRSASAKRAALEPYRLDERLLGMAAEDAIALHCLPAHPGEEITEGVLYGEHSAVWDQAENRLHAQKALLEFLLIA